MPFQPAIDDPSKAWPCSNFSLVKYLTGTVTCCSLPRVSVKRKSTNFTSLSLTSFNTSSGVIAIESLLSRVLVVRCSCLQSQRRQHIPCQTRVLILGAFYE